MPIPQTQNILRSYFENGKKPDESQFWEFIDTMYVLYQQAVDAADALQAVADQVSEAAPDFLLIAKRISVTPLNGNDPREAAAHWQILRSYNFDHVTAYTSVVGTARYNFWTKKAFTLLPDAALTIQNGTATGVIGGKFINPSVADAEFNTSAFQLAYYNASANNVPLNGYIRVAAWGVLTP